MEEFAKHKAQIDGASTHHFVDGERLDWSRARIRPSLNCGKDVTIIEPASYLLNNLVPPSFRLNWKGEPTKAGVTVETDSAVCRNVSPPMRLQTTSSRLMRTDIVIAAAGLRPHAVSHTSGNRSKQKGLWSIPS
ncbi:hypothetical protein O9992_22610 [Vibrio lentus]|nr:hypothetical protein [Vibrio lentus]